MSEEEVKPGDEATITLKSTANSVVYLTAVDVSVNILKSGNQINKSEVLSTFLKNIVKADEKSSKSKFPIFTESNAFILTNADKGFTSCDITDRLDIDDNKNEINTEEKPVNLSEDEFLPAEIASATESRKDFPETWIFGKFKVDGSGNFQLKKKVPESITSWLIDGFSMNPSNGLGFADTQKLSVFQKFFIQVEMPRSVKLGEIAKIVVFAYDYTNANATKSDAIIEMMNDENEFEFIEIGSNCEAKNILNPTGNKMVETIAVTSGTPSLLNFFIRPTKTGQIKLTIKAKLRNAGDAVERLLSVKHEGVSHYRQKSLLVDLRTKKFYSHYFYLELNKTETVEGSIKVGASAVGNVMGPMNDENLPKSTGLAKFALIIFNFEYLNAKGKLSKKMREESEDVLLTGYQDLIKTKRDDGSFGNIWATAFAVKVLAHAKHWIEIDDTHIVDALKFLDQKQQNGSFKEDNETNGNLELTAFVLTAFLENDSYAKEFKGAIDEANEFLRFNSKSIDNTFALALASYALVLNQAPERKDFLSLLKKNAIVEGNMTHWNLEMRRNRKNAITMQPMKIEIASYALLAFLKDGNFEEALPILSWLVSNGNVKGRFFYSRDTFIALQALSEAARVFHSDNFNLDITLDVGNDVPKKISINQNNALEEQNILLSETDSVSVQAEGTGLASLDVWWKFNTKADASSKRFDITVKHGPRSGNGLLVITICAKFIAKNKQTESNLAIMEIEMPSGYEFHSNMANSLEEADVKVIKHFKRFFIEII